MISKNKSPFQNTLGKQLILSKIDLNEHKDMKSHIEKVFTDPNYYFNDEFNGHPVIIGKKHSKYIISRRSTRKSIHNRLNRISQSKSETSNSKKNVKDKSMQKINISSLNNNQRQIEHDELKGIYKRFHEINLENSNERNMNKTKYKNQFIDKELTEDINNKDYKTLKKEIEHELNFQEQVLNKKKLEDAKIENLTKNISKKIKRPISKLLITQNEEYRIKKEIQDIFFNEVQNSFQEPLYKWYVTLRDKDIHFINDGNEKNPIWNYYINKKDENQTVRNPNLFYKTDFNFYQSNNYLKQKIPNKTFYCIKKNLNETMTGFNKMYIKGKNLLDVEIENSKFLKGRKIVLSGNLFSASNALINNYNFNDKNNKDVIFKNNIDAKEIKKKGRAISTIL